MSASSQSSRARIGLRSAGLGFFGWYRTTALARAAGVLVLLVLFFFARPRALFAQSERWTFQIGAARSDVSLEDADVVWGTDSAQIIYQNQASGGFHFGFAIERRDELFDHVFVGGGYRRLGDWTLSGQVGFALEPDFYYRNAVEGAISRRLAGALVGTFTYRYLNFPTANVRIVQPAATYYFPWGEIGGQIYLTRNDSLKVDSTAYSFRGIWQDKPRLRLAAGVSVGERIFDITSLVEEPADGWVTFADLRYSFTDQDAVGVQLELAHEEPAFDKRGLGLYYRRSF